MNGKHCNKKFASSSHLVSHKKSTLERSRMNAIIVTKNLHSQINWLDIKEATLERSLMIEVNVARNFPA